MQFKNYIKTHTQKNKKRTFEHEDRRYARVIEL